MYKKYIQLRDERGLTDYKVSVETGIAKSTFTDWKTGRSKPKIEKLQKLADYFQVPVTYFLEEKKEEGWGKKMFFILIPILAYFAGEQFGTGIGLAVYAGGLFFV